MGLLIFELNHSLDQEKKWIFCVILEGRNLPKKDSSPVLESSPDRLLNESAVMMLQSSFICHRPEALLRASFAASISSWKKRKKKGECNGKSAVWKSQTKTSHFLTFRIYAPFCFCFDLPKLGYSTADFYQNSLRLVNKARKISIERLISFQLRQF